MVSGHTTLDELDCELASIGACIASTHHWSRGNWSVTLRSVLLPDVVGGFGAAATLPAAIADAIKDYRLTMRAALCHMKRGDAEVHA